MIDSSARGFAAALAIVAGTFALPSPTLLAAEGGTPENSNAPVRAHWSPKKINFTYQGITATYSCDGLLDDVRAVLRQLGASKLKVRASGCTSRLGGPDPFPGVTGTFLVLEPGDAASGADASPAVTARWQRVKVNVGEDPRDAAGRCELVEQIKRYILPLFAARNIAFQSNCFPHDVVIGGASLEADVLQAERPETAASNAQ